MSKLRNPKQIRMTEFREMTETRIFLSERRASATRPQVGMKRDDRKPVALLDASVFDLLIVPLKSTLVAYRCFPH